MKQHFTDGGLGLTGLSVEDGHEDCTVRSVAIAFQISYADAHARLKAAGRKDGKSMYNFQEWLGVQRIGKYQARLTLMLPTMTLKQAASAPGRYIVRVKASRYAGHVFAVIDGTVYDQWAQSPRKRVTHIWKLEEEQ